MRFREIFTTSVINEGLLSYKSIRKDYLELRKKKKIAGRLVAKGGKSRACALKRRSPRAMG